MNKPTSTLVHDDYAVEGITPCIDGRFVILNLRNRYTQQHSLSMICVVDIPTWKPQK